MWLEDYSGVFELFDQWRAQGISDLGAFLQARPQLAAQCSARIRLLHVNPATLALYAAGSVDELSERLDEVLRGDTFESLIQELLQLWSGRRASRAAASTTRWTAGAWTSCSRACCCPPTNAMATACWWSSKT